MTRGRVATLVMGLLAGLVAAWWLVPAEEPGFHPVPLDDHDDTARLVSLAPAITETIAALGDRSVLVGRSDWCRTPASITDLPAVGSALTPNLEGIVGLHPSRILVDGSQGIRIDQLKALAPVEVLPWLTVEEMVRSIRRLGAIVDRYVAAETLAARVENTLAVPPPEAGPVVLMVLAGGGLDNGEVWYVKRNSVHGAVLHAAGGRHAIDRDVEGAPVLSLEQLVSLDPDHLVLMASGAVDPDRVAALEADWSRMTSLAAVREGRVHVVMGEDLLSVGPSVLDTVQAVRRALFPDGAAANDPQAAAP